MGARKNPFAETKVISTNGAVCSQSSRWRVGWPCRSIGPPTVLRVTTPLASTAKFHLLTSFQNHGLTILDPGANQNESKIVRKRSIATRDRETTEVLSLAAKGRAREKRLRRREGGRDAVSGSRRFRRNSELRSAGATHRAVRRRVARKNASRNRAARNWRDAVRPSPKAIRDRQSIGSRLPANRNQPNRQPTDSHDRGATELGGKSISYNTITRM